MSQDLLAEFGDFSVKDSEQNTEPVRTHSSLLQQDIQPSGNSWQSQSKLAHEARRGEDLDHWGNNGDDDDDDDFGDFEEPEQYLNNSSHQHKRPEQAAQKVLESNTPVVAKKATSARDLSSKHPFASNPDLLFDADEYDEYAEQQIEEDEDDDFGDFETSGTPAPTTRSSIRQQPTTPVKQQKTVDSESSSATFDLLGLDSDIPPATPNNPRPPPVSTAPPKSTKPVSKVTTKQHTQVAHQKSTLLTEDAWDDFETLQPSKPAQQAFSNEPPTIDLPVDLLGDLTTQPNASGVAPSNVPPPSLLLTLFPPVLSALSQRFLHPLGALPSTEKTTFLSMTRTKVFLASYLTLTHVLAHVIAGRKSRWKRDKHLAQSMRIGPSVSGRSGGMKLAGLDRSEAGREDTEIEDVLRVWREQVGRLKSAVSGAATTAKLAVPELASVMPVRTAKAPEGVIASTQACALCGLKREERVAKVDTSVEDSFGEWWIEGTNMHTACLNFWDMFKGRLNSR